MKASKLLYKLLPVSMFSRLRILYFRCRRQIFRSLSESEVDEILKVRMGIKPGDTVFVHSSMDFLNINFNVFKLLTLLLDSVGDEGTLVFPAWHFNYRAEEYLKKDLIFDVKKSPSAMGLLSEIARRHNKAHRSTHPTTSIVAIGKHAQELVAEHSHSVYPCGEKSPFFKMMNYDAKIIGVGVSTHFLSFVHCPEDILKNEFPYNTRTEQVFEAKVKEPDGSIVNVSTLAAHSDISNRDMPTYFQKYVPKEVLNVFRIRGNDFYVGNATALYSKMVELARRGITIYSV
jgi:aminoglycoside 3-N-acetyltransferase